VARFINVVRNAEQAAKDEGGGSILVSSPFTTVGVSYQQALSNYIEGPLLGEITAADYPEGGEGRIVQSP
jgi:hypothetical protein